MSPATYRKMIKPYHKRLNALIKQHTDATIFFHCCGNFAPLMDDLLDAGFEAFHPVQVSALSDPAGLKKQYGDRATFWGGIDSQHVLPHGTPADVREEVRLRISQFAAAAAISPAPCTTSSPTCRHRTSWRCATRCANLACIRSAADVRGAQVLPGCHEEGVHILPRRFRPDRVGRAQDQPASRPTDSYRPTHRLAYLRRPYRAR